MGLTRGQTEWADLPARLCFGASLPPLFLVTGCRPSNVYVNMRNRNSCPPGPGDAWLVCEDVRRFCSQITVIPEGCNFLKGFIKTKPPKQIWSGQEALNSQSIIAFPARLNLVTAEQQSLSHLRSFKKPLGATGVLLVTGECNWCGRLGDYCNSHTSSQTLPPLPNYRPHQLTPSSWQRNVSAHACLKPLNPAAYIL